MSTNPKLTPAQLLSLDKLSEVPLAEVRTQDPRLYPTLDTKAANERKATVTAALAGSSAQLTAALPKVDFRIGAGATRPLTQVVLDSLSTQKVPAAVAKEAIEKMSDLSRSSSLADPAEPATKVGQHPLFQAELQQAGVVKLAIGSDIALEKTATILDHSSTPGQLRDDNINEMLGKNVITADQATSLGLTASLYHLSDDSTDTAAALRKGLAASLEVPKRAPAAADGTGAQPRGTDVGNGVPSVKQLVSLGVDGWRNVIERGGATPPGDLTAEEFADRLDRSMTSLYPTDALMVRVLDEDKSNGLAAKVGRMEPQLSRVRDKSSRSNGSVVAAMREASVDGDEARKARDDLLELVNLHPGLRLDEVLAADTGPQERAAAIAQRVDLVKTVYTLNPGAELLTRDYSPDSEEAAALDYGKLDDKERKLVVSDLKSYQRAFAITDDVADTHTLLKAGYHTAAVVGRASLDEFKARTKLADDVAVRYHENARSSLSKTTNSLVSIVDLMRGGFGDIFVGNLLPSIKDYLKKLDGFSDLFGSQDHCNCTHCQSILGPSAYFVDLMSFIDEHVREPYFSGSHAGDRLDLRKRRPDLWTLPLTCANTDTLVRYLDIINEILENYLAKRGGYVGDLGDRAAVEDFVYRLKLLAVVDSFRQPFHFPLEKLNSYLAHFERNRGDVAEVLSVSPAVRTQAALGISRAERELITTPDTDMAFLRRVYGVSFTVGTGGIVDPVGSGDFLRFTGLDRDRMGELVATAFVTADGAEPIEFKTFKSAADSVQNDVERVKGLRASSLDRLHRMARLLRLLPWSIPETDLVLTQLAATGVPGGLSQDTLEALVEVLDVHKRFGVKAEQNCALWGPVPTTGTGGKPSLFDRLFNPPTFVHLDGELPKDDVSFVHPSLRTTGVPSPADNTLHRLLAGCGISDEALGSLIRVLAVPLGADITAPVEDDRGFLLTEANLTLLYRHARLGQLLRLPVAEQFALIGLAGLPLGHVSTLAELGTLLEFHTWWKSSGYKLDDLAVVTGATPTRPETYPNPQTAAEAILGRVAADKSLEFADTVFAFVPGVTEAQSKAIIAANPAVWEAVPGGTGALRLVAGFDPDTPLAVPADVTVAEPDIRMFLLRHHASQLLPSLLATQLGFSADRITELVAMTGTSPSAPELVTALHGGDITPLVDLVTALVPLSVLFKSKVFDAASLQFIRTHPALFGIAGFDAVDVSAVRRLSVYARFAAMAAESAFNPELAPVSVDDLRHCLATFDPVAKFAGSDPVRLAATLRTEEAMIATLLPHLSLPDGAPEALDTLGRAVQLASYLGVGGDTLGLIVSDDYIELNRAAEAMLAAFRAKYPDEKEFASKLDPFGDRIANRRRDGLTDYLIRSVHPELETLDEIYQYFLVDVQFDGCARTSRLVAAISSAQLYVHRVLMNLEQDRREPSDPLRTAVPPAAIPKDEWAWRKNYRVWEANRKVFLWPENYIEPQLRDDKTPLFENLESVLLQQEINEQNVLDGYSDYMSGFDELSKLSIAGAYHDKHHATRTDVLHLFGVTPGDPPTFYYRRVENAHFGEIDAGKGVEYGPWTKIEVQIPVRKVAPVVFNGRLYVFWTDVTTNPKNSVSDGGSSFVGYKHKMSMKYTTLRLDGKWSPPQPVSLTGGQFPTGEGIIDDPLAESAEREAFTDAIGDLRLNDAMQAWIKMLTPKFDTKMHPEPVDGYSLGGASFDRVYPQVYGSELRVTGRNFQMRADVDFYRKAIESHASGNVHGAEASPLLESRPEFGWHRLYAARPWFFALDGYANASAIADKRRVDRLSQITESYWTSILLSLSIYQREPLAYMFSDPDMTTVNGSLADGIVDLDSDLIYLQGASRPGSLYVAKRFGTTLGEEMNRTLFTGGVDQLLATSSQQAMGERYPLVWFTGSQVDNQIRSGRLDFTGAMGTYFREVYFHIPFLIANHLNGEQKFEAAQQWYHYIFDPTSSEEIFVPPSVPPAEAARRRRDRVWRYSEFRGLTMPKLREVLTDPAAIEVYKKDPFNPHAIARLRLSAYQKCIVMRYVDNLIDWGDSLFSQFTMESTNEATMKYVMASDILGPRPAKIGSCGEAAVVPRTYEKIGPLVKNGSEFLVELENLLWVRTPGRHVYGTIKRPLTYALDRDVTRYFVTAATRRAPARPSPEPVDVRELVGAAAPRYTGNPGPSPDARTKLEITASALAEQAVAPQISDAGIARFDKVNRTYTASWAGTQNTAKAGAAISDRAGNVGDLIGAAANGGGTRDGVSRVVGADRPLIRDFERVPMFGWSIIRQLTPVFCVPANKDLYEYWDRVDDRLYKLRHCMDIQGVKRQLALFAPEIDPRLLVRARAAGLSIEDVLGSTSGDLPPYRFSYLIEKAKQHCAVVQSFGGALLSALERKDAEELNRLRAVHQQNLLKMSTRVREWDIDIAADAVDNLDKQIAAVTYKRDYFAALTDGGLNAPERIQQVSRHLASATFIGGALLQGTAGVLSLIPQLGSPFAMKYGGVELGSSVKAWGQMLSDTAKVAEVVSSSAGLEAGFARRSEGWEHQRELAEHELEQLEVQREIAELRRQIAIRSLDIHGKQIEQAEEVFELYGSRFSNLALYTYMAATMQRLYREAYNSAYASARLAEQAFRFERGDETSTLLRGDYYDSDRAGLLAGEKLKVDLDNMERRFVETNYRTPEIDQAFSLGQVSAQALMNLRQTGECDFEIGEVFFDLFYPGQYKRRIKSVRLTIPSVTGPYTNVGASLSLTGSKIRPEPQLGEAGLMAVPLRRSVSIATSTAQNDSGVFEFSFRDERYMPFEGAGAVSSWRLELPKSFRPFDYQTITDVIVHISYTAESDGVLRGKVEEMNAAIDGTIANYLSGNAVGRIYGLRQDFGAALDRLIHSPTGTAVPIELTDRHLPVFLRGRDLTVSAAKLAIRTAEGVSASSTTMSLNGTSFGGFSQDPDLGDVYTKDVATAFAAGMLGTHTLRVAAAGELGPDSPEPGDPAALDAAKVLDVLLYLELRLT